MLSLELPQRMWHRPGLVSGSDDRCPREAGRLATAAEPAVKTMPKLWRAPMPESRRDQAKLKERAASVVGLTEPVAFRAAWVLRHRLAATRADPRRRSCREGSTPPASSLPPSL